MRTREWSGDPKPRMREARKPRRGYTCADFEAPGWNAFVSIIIKVLFTRYSRSDGGGDPVERRLSRSAARTAFPNYIYTYGVN